GATPLGVDGMYDRLAAQGYTYGPAFQGVTAAWRDGAAVYAEVRLPEGTDVDGFTLHPALLDAALHPLLPAAFSDHGTAETGALRLPFAWSGVEVHAAGATAVRVRLTELGPDEIALDLWDPTGAPVAAVGSLRVRPVAAVADDSATPRDLYRVDWTPIAAPDAPATTGDDWAVVGEDRIGLGAALGTAATASDLAALAALTDDQPAPSVVLAPITQGRPVRGSGYDPVRAAHEPLHQVLTLLQDWLTDARFARSRLILVTRGAMPTHTHDLISDQAFGVWGLVRSAQSEHPGRFVIVDIDHDPASLSALPSAVAVALDPAGGDADEPQLTVRHGTVLAPRLARVTPDVDRLELPDDGPWRLAAADTGSLHDIAAVPAPDAAEPLAPGEVRVRIHAAGLNFRDSLIALGVYPGRARLGTEAAGVVTEVGPDVAGLAPGDRVMGLFSGAIGPLAVADPRMVHRIPRGWSFAQAAAAPAVFVTAYYALVDLAAARPGESVLVHSAAGGVGMAATQLARHLGLVVHGTASRGKWEALAFQGLDAADLSDSRTLDFEREILERTGGRGVDIVLDAATGAFVDASLRLLPRGGRFLEMGKADVRDADAVAAAHPGVAYRAFDLGEVAPSRIQEILAELVRLFEAGALRALPVHAWDVRRAPAAFRHLSQARHTGKLVLTMPRRLDPDGTTLITGGLGALGAVTARHLVAAHGVRRLLLVGRRGAATEGAAELVDELRTLGADVRVEACDVGDADAVAALVRSIPAAHPLTAIVHTAGSLDDGTLESLTPERVDAVVRPKMDAAWHLLRATLDTELAAFVLFSSFAGVAGNAGQAGYAAANTMLDGLACYLRSAGQPATSLAWGLWDGPGLAAGTPAAAITASGLAPLDAERGMALLDAALTRDEHLLVPARLRPKSLRARAAAGTLPPLLRGLVRAPAARQTAAAASGASSLAERLAGESPEARERLLLDLV
ncbi:MAG: SDR family NAD(P)-dependent oxidoreductase, partial [Streptomycetaceae bacterium]|nr:SDR family NAD(P)-dependent oxidoreductase [Streptomycetaceae bacterium]